MIINPQYKLIANQIAKLFCNTDVICQGAVRQRIYSNFDDQSFEFFLQNIEVGRFYLLRYSNWRVHNNQCRKMAITANLTDAITGEIITDEWYYDNANCNEKQWYYPDLNNLMKKNNRTVLSPLIQNKTTTEITKVRLIYSPNKPSYGITYTPPVPGGGGSGGGVQITPPKGSPPAGSPPASIPDMPIQSGFDIKGLFENPIVLIGVGLLAVYLIMKK